MTEHDKIFQGVDKWTEKNSLSDFTGDELKLCERMEFFDFIQRSEIICTRGITDIHWDIPEDSPAHDMFKNLGRLTNPYLYYQKHGLRDEDMKEIHVKTMAYAKKMAQDVTKALYGDSSSF